MRKLLSVLLIAVMLLSLTGAVAEGNAAMELTAGVMFDTETALSMIQVLGGVTDETQLALVRSVLAVASNFTAVTSIGSTGGDVSLRLSSQEFANIIFGQTEDKIAVTSSLFPNFALTMDPVMLEKTMGTSGINLDPQAMDEVMKALEPYSKDFEDFFAGLTTDMETTQGAFAVEGVLYSSYVSLKFTSDRLLNLALTLVERAQNDAVLQGLVTQIMAQTDSASDTSVPEALAAAHDQLTAGMKEATIELASFKQYANDTGNYYVLETVPMDESTIRLVITENKRLGGSSATFQMVIAEKAVTDWDAAILEMQNGQGSTGVLLQGTMDTSLTAVDNRASGGLQIIAGGMGGLSVVLTTESVMPFDDAAAKTISLGLGLGAGNPLVKFNLSAVPAQEVKAIDLTGKTLIEITPEMSDETMVPLQNDIMTNGMPALLAHLQEIAPEASLLITLLMAGGQTMQLPVPAMTANP